MSRLSHALSNRADIQRIAYENHEIAAGGKSHMIHFTLLAHSPLAHGTKHDYLRLQVENLRGRMENVVLTIHLLLALGLVGIVLLQRSEGGGLEWAVVGTMLCQAVVQPRNVQGDMDLGDCIHYHVDHTYDHCRTKFIRWVRFGPFGRRPCSRRRRCT